MPTFSESERRTILRHYLRTNLFFLLWFGCNRKDLDHPWLFDRCMEVQESPDGHLDLWAREHYKSTIITFGKTMQDIFASHGEEPLAEWEGREATFGIFSHNRPLAKKSLKQIKTEFETNPLFKFAFPDILYQDPGKEASKWSEDDGIVVKRKSNPGESTVEAWGLVDGQPIGKHFLVLVYDDVVTDKSVTSPDMMEKTTDSLSLSYNLGSRGGRRRFIGTRYHFGDSYGTIEKRGTVKVRKYEITEDGTETGTPRLLKPEEVAQKRRDNGPYIFSCQHLLNPVADALHGFRREWIRYWKADEGSGMNKYLLVDPASEQKKHSDYTSMWVVGLGTDKNHYVLAMLRDRLSPSQRVDKLMEWHRKYRPFEVRYEKYGKDADIAHIQAVQDKENYRFDVTAVGGTMAKADRIKRLIPMFEQHTVYLPETHYITDYERIPRDMVQAFIEEEYVAFPVPLHDDMLDAFSRICDTEGTTNGEKRNLSLVWPAPEADPNPKRDRYGRRERGERNAWAA